jgi:hypothetical protein
LLDIKSVEKLINWANKDKERSVKIEVVNKEERVFVYDFSIMSGMIISNDRECDNLDKLMEEENKRKIEEEYKRLKIISNKLNKINK